MKKRKALSLLLAIVIAAGFIAAPTVAENELSPIKLLGNTSIGWEGFLGDSGATQLVLEVQTGAIDGFGSLQLVIQGAAGDWVMEETMLAASFSGAFDYSGTTYVVIDLTGAKGFEAFKASTEDNDNWINLGFWGNELISLSTVKNAWLTDAKLDNTGAVTVSGSVWLSKGDVFAGSKAAEPEPKPVIVADWQKEELSPIRVLGNTSIGWDGFLGDSEPTHLVLELQTGGISGFGTLQLVVQGAANNWVMQETLIAASFSGTFDYSGTTYAIIDLTGANGYDTLLASTEDDDIWVNLGFWGNELISLNTVKSAWLTNAELDDAGFVTVSNNLRLAKAIVWPEAPPPPQGDLDLDRVNEYDGRFTDVTADIAPYITAVYEVGLMDSVSATLFGTAARLTFAELYTIAAKLHAGYYGGMEQIDDVQAALMRRFGWDEPESEIDKYVDYLWERGVISRFRWEDYYWFGLADVIVTRAILAEVFAGILPAAELEAIRGYPGYDDVKAGTQPYNVIVLLYEAGIFNADGGRIRPNTAATRGETAVILAKLIDIGLRG
jgi:hypothetical protein